MKLKVLIVDDEALSRERVRRFLTTEHDTVIVGECGSGKEAVAAIRRDSPDLVFLDVRMPELDGFGVLKELNGVQPPGIIFVTAHHEFATRAFDIHAVDYLLKPFDHARFRTALNRARERLQRRNGLRAQSRRHSNLISSPYGDPVDFIPVRSSGRIRLLKHSEIDWISAADNYAELHVGPVTYMLRSTITALADRFLSARFVRISRSILVNLDRITEIRPKSHGDYVIVLNDGACLTGSRNHRSSLARLLGKPT